MQVRSSTAGSSRRMRTPMDRGAGSRQALTSGGSTHRSHASSVVSEAEASEGGGVPIWITFNEGKGNHMKPWIIHQVRVCGSHTKQQQRPTALYGPGHHRARRLTEVGGWVGDAAGAVRAGRARGAAGHFAAAERGGKAGAGGRHGGARATVLVWRAGGARSRVFRAGRQRGVARSHGRSVSAGARLWAAASLRAGAGGARGEEPDGVQPSGHAQWRVMA